MPAQSLAKGLRSSRCCPSGLPVGRRSVLGFQPDSTWDSSDSPSVRRGPAVRFASGSAWTSVTIAEESSRRPSTKPFGCFAVVRSTGPDTGSASRIGTATLATVSTCCVWEPSDTFSRLKLTVTSYAASTSKNTAGSTCLPRCEVEPTVSAAWP